MKQFDYVTEAAKRTGWKMEEIEVDGQKMAHYTKGELHFYSHSRASIQVNHVGPLLSENKVLMSSILKVSGIPHVEVSRIDLNNLDDVYDAYSENETKEVVCKPVRGKRSRGVKKCSSWETVFSELLHTKEEICLSTYYPHEAEIRYIVYKGEVVLVFPKKDYIALRPNELRSFDSIPKAMIDEMKTIAEKAASEFMYTYVAIDFLVNDQDFLLLETNTNPSLAQYSECSEEHAEKAVNLIENLFHHKEKLLREENWKK